MTDQSLKEKLLKEKAMKEQAAKASAANVNKTVSMLLNGKKPLEVRANLLLGILQSGDPGMLEVAKSLLSKMESAAPAAELALPRADAVHDGQHADGDDVQAARLRRRGTAAAARRTHARGRSRPGSKPPRAR